MTRINFTVLAATILIYTASPAFAGMANGAYNHDFSGEVPLWDISGSYSYSDGGTVVDFTLTEDPSGGLTGTGTYNFNNTGIALTGSATITGKISGPSTAPKVSFKVLVTNGSGMIEIEGITHDVTFTGTINANSNLDGAHSQLVFTSGSTLLKLLEPSTGRRKTLSGKVNHSTLALPVDSDGDWTLDLTLNPVPSSTKYTGTSTVTTSPAPGTPPSFTATGTYTSRTDTSKITLKRTGSSLNLLISTAGSNMTVKSANGTLYGQTVKYTAH
jgi:hypothetical protein